MDRLGRDEHLYRAGELETDAAEARLGVLLHREHPHVRQMLVLEP